tara:strand:- start:2482 stop:3546 length:1065 start_codon:yes stop_codon:yes gene_type:complete
MKITYGTDKKAIDVTAICMEKLKVNDIITIPSYGKRSKYFKDPVYGAKKKIFIENDGTINEYNENLEIQINLINNNITSKFKKNWNNSARRREYFNTIEKITVDINLPVFNTGGKLIIALFEWRTIEAMKWVLNAVLKVYNSEEIGLAIVHGTKNEIFVKENFGHWKNVLLINTGDENHNHDSYSNRLITPEIWENFINWSHVLVYQWDALILRKIPDIYFKYDFIGSPNNQKKGRAGNGGFSLRNVKSMIKVCEPYRNKNIEDFKCPHKYEDGFFCHQKLVFPNHKNKDELSLHREFSVETIYIENPVGLHKVYHWIGDDNFEKIISNIEKKLLDNTEEPRDNNTITLPPPAP